MFERFTERAKRVVVLAQEEARMLDHGYIGTEHLLLGLIHEGEGVPARLLESLGLTLEGLRAWIEENIGRGSITPSGHIPFTPRAKLALEMSLREALTLGDNYIGVEHVLLGLLHEMGSSNGAGEAAKALVAFEISPVTLRRQCLVMAGIDEDALAERRRAIERERLQKQSEHIETVLLPRARGEVERLEAKRDEIALRLATSQQ